MVNEFLVKATIGMAHFGYSSGSSPSPGFIKNINQGLEAKPAQGAKTHTHT
jgi:hypothetical protein